MAADDIEGEDAAVAPWRCVDAARYVVALAVTALMVTIIAHAIRVLLRPDDFYLLVDKGSVVVERGTPAWNLTFAMDLEVTNPSGRVAIYYEEVAAYLYGRANSKTKPEYFMNIPMVDIFLKPQSTQFQYVRAYAEDLRSDYKAYFDLLYKSGTKGIPDGVVALNGTLTVGLYSWRNQTPKAVTYYCSPVAIGGDSSDNTGGGQCSENPPTEDATLKP